MKSQNTLLRIKYFLMILILCGGLMGIAAVDIANINCGGSSGGGGGGEEPDVITNATPWGIPPILDGVHTGYRDGHCAKCHGADGAPHYAGYSSGVCATCHGANGAPPRSYYHAEKNCKTCHLEAHGGHIDSDHDCMACHQFQKNGSTCTHGGSYDIVVIGAGGGGLAAASALARSGYSVAVIEKNYKVGGMMGTFKRGDYTIEQSLHGFNGVDDLSYGNGLDGWWLKYLGIFDKINPVKAGPTIYRASLPDLTIDLPADPVEYKQILIDTFPHEEEGINGLFDLMYDTYYLLELGMKLLPPDFDADLPSDYEGLEIADLMDFLALMDTEIGNSAMMSSLSEVLDPYITDERLFTVLTQLAPFLGCGPDDLPGMVFVMMLAMYHFGGYYYFEGGSGALAEALAEVIEENGGTIILNTLATKIDMEDPGLLHLPRATRVRTDDGGCYEAKYVVSNAPAPDTYFNMIGEEWLPNWFVNDMKEMSISYSAFNVYLGVDHDFTPQWPDGAHTIMVNTTYNMQDHFDALEACDPWNTGFGLGNYSVSDPTAAPPGKNVIAVTGQLGYHCPLGSDEWNWQEGHESYWEYAQEMADAYLTRAEALIPGLRDHIEVMEIGTPVTIGQFARAPEGAIVGWTINTQQMMDLPVLGNIQTPIGNLFMASQWAFPGGGQTPVLVAGMVTAANIKLRSGNEAPDRSFPTSLHATRNGMRAFCEADDGDDHFIGDGIENAFERFWWWDQIEYDDLSCKDCHAEGNPNATGCDMCHTDLDLYQDEIPDDTCLGCHSRQSKEIELGLTDVHKSNPYLDECTECHSNKELHGDGREPQSLWQYRDTTCISQGCHFESGLSEENHGIHTASLDCSACHLESVVTCYNCHLDTFKENDVKKSYGALKDWIFLVNGEDGKVRAGNFQSLTYQDESMVVFAPFHAHAVKREARTCNDCHGNQAMQELDATGKIVVTSFDEGSGTLSHKTGVIPVIDGALEFSFLNYHSASDIWTQVGTTTDNLQYGYCTPLSSEQVEALR